MNRKVRRLMKANAPSIAAEMAGQAFDYTPAGKLVKVSHPAAVAALTRAFQHMLLNGGEPHTIRISSATAEAFPRGVPTPEGATSYIAVGMDPDGRGTYSIRAAVTPHAPPEIAEMLNREAVLHHLQPHLQTRGFPIGDAQA